MEKGRMLAQVKPTLLKRLPIRHINEKKSTDKAAHDKHLSFPDLVKN